MSKHSFLGHRAAIDHDNRTFRPYAAEVSKQRDSKNSPPDMATFICQVMFLQNLSRAENASSAGHDARRAKKHHHKRHPHGKHEASSTPTSETSTLSVRNLLEASKSALPYALSCVGAGLIQAAGATDVDVCGKSTTQPGTYMRLTGLNTAGPNGNQVDAAIASCLPGFMNIACEMIANMANITQPKGIFPECKRNPNVSENPHNPYSYLDGIAAFTNNGTSPQTRTDMTAMLVRMCQWLSPTPPDHAANGKLVGEIIGGAFGAVAVATLCALLYFKIERCCEERREERENKPLLKSPARPGRAVAVPT